LLRLLGLVMALWLVVVMLSRVNGCAALRLARKGAAAVSDTLTPEALLQLLKPL
jgi:hypothetical protein